MGAWGVGLYQDDVTCDIKEDYVNWLKIGYSKEEATEAMLERNSDFLDDEEDADLFWFALADIEWKYGRLLPEVKKEALKRIESGRDLERWEENGKQYEKRRQVLEKLKEQLNSPQPPEKKVPPIKVYRANWDIGDVLLYQIKNEELKDHKYYGKYVLLRAVGIVKSNQGSLPREYDNEESIIGLYNWIGDKEPDIEIIDKLSFAIEKATRYRRVKETGEIVEVERVSAFPFAWGFNRRELKKLDFKVILKDKNYKEVEADIKNGIGNEMDNINTLDYSLINMLEAPYNKDKQINDTK